MSNSLTSSQSNSLPLHVAFIVDGNRRWARIRGLPEVAGHTWAVNKVLDRLIFHAQAKGIKYLTFWTFSTENWSRGKLFAKALFALLERSIRAKAAGYHKKGLRLNTIGDLDKLPKNLKKMLITWQEKTKDNPGITVTLAINYGGRDEVVRAIKKLFQKQFNNLKIEQFSQYLDTAGMPDPELIIRTGGEKRLSGFLLWQSQYAELYFTDVLFPDFGTKDFDQALEWFSKRERKFGR